MNASSPRIPPLHPEEFTDEQKELVGPWSVLNFSRVLARHPSLYRVFVPVVEKVIRYTDLPPRDREVLVIRTLAQCNETYEADHHADIAGKCGMSAAEIAAVKEGAGDGLSAFDLQLINAADELLRDKFISAMTWKKLAERYTTLQLMEVVGLVGCYTTMAMVTKTFEIQIERSEATTENLAALRQYT